jgi:hypothetical protein
MRMRQPGMLLCWSSVGRLSKIGSMKKTLREACDQIWSSFTRLRGLGLSIVPEQRA